MDDMQLLSERYDKTCIERTRAVAETPFVRLTYTEAINVLLEHVKKGKKFEYDVGRCKFGVGWRLVAAAQNPLIYITALTEWGIDLSSEHERFLAEVVYKGPVIVYNYPTAIKVQQGDIPLAHGSRTARKTQPQLAPRRFTCV